MATPVKPNPFDERFIRRLLLSTPTISLLVQPLKQTPVTSLQSLHCTTIDQRLIEDKPSVQIFDTLPIY